MEESEKRTQAHATFGIARLHLRLLLSYSMNQHLIACRIFDVRYRDFDQF